MIQLLLRIAAQAAKSAQVIAAATESRSSGLGVAISTYRIVVAIVPGPAIIGMASGKTLISSRVIASSSSVFVSRVPEGRPKSISTATKNSNAPPAILNAYRLIPRRSSRKRPTRAKKRIMPALMKVALATILLRCASVRCAVSTTTTGASPTGSMIVKNVTNALIVNVTVINLSLLPHYITYVLGNCVFYYVASTCKVSIAYRFSFHISIPTPIVGARLISPQNAVMLGRSGLINRAPTIGNIHVVGVLHV